jgi:glycine cleavage system H protein
MSNYPSDRRYSKDHEWAKLDGKTAIIGVSAHAVEQLGDITLVNIDVRVKDKIEVGKGFGTIESVKTLSDLLAPVSGKVIAINEELDDAPELINDDCYEKGWMVKIEMSSPAEFEKLLNASAYEELVKEPD